MVILDQRAVVIKG